VTTLENRTEYREYGNQNHGVLKGNQATPNRRADAVSGVVGTDVPPDIDPGTYEN